MALPVRGLTASPLIAAITAAHAPIAHPAARDGATVDPTADIADSASCGRMIQAPAARANVQPETRIAAPKHVVPAAHAFRFDGHPEWFAIVDPARKQQAWIFDARFLLSAYQCIYGRGCPGTHEEIEDAALRAAIGCCTHGAYFENRADLERVAKVVRRLGPEDWHHSSPASRERFYRHEGGTAKDPWWHTRVRDKACIFINPPGSEGGEGCALHLLALQGSDRSTSRSSSPGSARRPPSRSSTRWSASRAARRSRGFSRAPRRPPGADGAGTPHRRRRSRSAPRSSSSWSGRAGAGAAEG